MSTFIRR